MPGPYSGARPGVGGGSKEVRKKVKGSPSVPVGYKSKGTTVPITPSGVTVSGKRVRRNETQRVRGALRKIRNAYKPPTSPRSEAGTTVTPSEVATLAHRLGSPPAEARALSTKVVGESGGNARAIGHDPGGTTGLGLLQITTGYQDANIAKHGGRAAMLRPKPNIKAAQDVIRSSGLGAWYAPSNAPGKIKKAPNTKKVREAKKVIAHATPGARKRAGVGKRPPKPKTQRLSGPWDGAQRAVLSKLPKSIRDEGRDDKRTPGENDAVGGSATSDHLTTNRSAYAADIPVNAEVYHTLQRELGLPQTATGEQTITKDGYRYQLIYGAEYGHGDHIHLGAEWTGASNSGASGSVGGAVSSGGTISTTGASKRRTPVRRGLTPRQRLKRVQGPYNASKDTSTASTDLDALAKKYGAVV